MLDTHCIVCGTQVSKSNQVGDRYDFDCPRCGDFAITGTGYGMIVSRLTPESKAVFSYTIQQMHAKTARPILDSNLIDWLWKNGQLPGAREQANNLILFLGRTLRRRYHNHQL